MDQNFESLRIEYRNILERAFHNDNIELLEDTTRSLGRNTEVDLKGSLDQAYRDKLLDLIEAESPVKILKDFVEFSIKTCRKSLSNATMPVLLLSEIFEALTLDICEEMFGFVEENVQVWKEDLFFAACKNNLLRLCNDLLRRLSRSTATVFCGKILLFLAKFFPFSERSGLNIVSEFNLDNITEYSRDAGDEIEVKTVDAAKSVVIDYSFYCKFWKLQDFFRNPNQCYNKVFWKEFCSHSSSILSVFQGIKIDYVSPEDNKAAYFAKYLTSQKLLDLQLYDVNFRRSVLLQFLIVFQYLTSSVKFKSESFELKPDQVEWIQQQTERIFNLLKETPPDGENFAKITKNTLERELLWNTWKNEGCPEIKKATPEVVSPASCENSRPFLGDLIKQAHSQNKYYLGNGELTKLWNFCPNNLESCKGNDRNFLPSLEDYFQEALEQLSKNGESSILKDSNFAWRALRLLARQSPQFFIFTSNPVQPLSAYLETMLKKNSLEKPGKTQTQPQEEEETILTEQEDNSEELKDKVMEFADDNSVTLTQLTMFSEKIQGDWEKLAGKFGYKTDEIEWLKSANPTDFERARNLLQLYFKDDEDATLDNFLYILEGLQMNEAADCVRQEIAENQLLQQADNTS